ncbi:MAG: hypothetical protein Q8933_20140 [Bacteroidota bacterium]|nr:hypothetical protein [Bacteroidota bacterium]
MKKSLILIVFALMIFAGKTKADHWNGGVTFDYFYQTLSPYGEWIELDRGLYAWHPYGISNRWEPYTEGRWVWSDYGWYWDSYEPYGWAVYHYGRWFYDDYYGWIWTPDYDWGPAWVEWRYSDEYVGWAPLPPYAVYRPGSGIIFTVDWHFPVERWNYVPCVHFYDYDVNHYLLPERVKYRVHTVTRYRTDYDYREGRIINRGIDRNIVERRTGREIVQRNIQETSRLRDFESSRRDRDRIEVYRPNRQEVNKVRVEPNSMDIKRAQRPTTLDVSKVERRRETTVPDSRNNPERQPAPQRVQRKAEPNVKQEPNVQQPPERRVYRQRSEEGNSNVEKPRESSTERNNQGNVSQPQVRERRVEEGRQAVPNRDNGQNNEKQRSESGRERRR